ncbi:MAG: Fic/DOC family protein [Dermatophilaceae bacterium]
MSEFVDPYLDPTTGILRNLAHARTQVALDKAEGDLSASRLYQLGERYPVKATGDLAELRGIHRHLFQDVYPWAGEVRTVDISKGGSTFVPMALVDRAAGFAVEELRAERFLRGLGRAQFVDRLAHHYDQINHLHPFREGNGRTQRVFWSRVARDAGWQLDWRLTTRERNNEASRIASSSHDLRPLREMFDGITTTAMRGRGGATRSALDVARLSFPSTATQATSKPQQPAPGRGPTRPPTALSDRSPG